MIRYAIYARVSTREKGQDVEQQVPALREFAERLGGQVVLVFQEEESGGTADRAQFNAMFTAAYQRRFDVLLFWALDRFSREGPTATLKHLEKLRASGVGFKSYTEPFLDTSGPMGEGILALMAALAAQRLVQISTATKRGLEKKRAMGVKLGRPTLAPEKVAHIQELRRQGQSLRAISKETGVPVATVRGYVPKAAQLTAKPSGDI